MKILQGSIHIFTDRPDLTIKSFCRELDYQFKHKLPYEKIPESVIVQYPHAVSCFCHLGLSYDYIAKMYSKRRKSPVLVSIVGRVPVPGGEERQGLRLYWGIENKCITEIELSNYPSEMPVKTHGIEMLKAKLDNILPKESVLFSSLDGHHPIDVASTLSNELGIFLGCTPLDDYLHKCTLKKELALGRVYQCPN